MLGAQASSPAVCDEGSPEIKEAVPLSAFVESDANRYSFPDRKGRSMDEETCTHIEAISVIKHPHKRVCEECAKIGAQWLHLRTCQECNATLCCDSSPNQHASKHAHSSGHPVIASAEPGERWLYCYPDDAFAEY